MNAAMDELVEKAALAAWEHSPMFDSRDDLHHCRCGIQYGVQHPENTDHDKHRMHAVLEAVGLPALLERVEAAEGARDALAQAIHDGRGILGFDNDGDDKPHTSHFIQYAAFWVNDAQELRNDHDAAGDEYDALDTKVERLGEAARSLIYFLTMNGIFGDGNFNPPTEDEGAHRVDNLRAALDAS